MCNILNGNSSVPKTSAQPWGLTSYLMSRKLTDTYD